MKTKKIGIVIQARMGSTRLYGKIVKELSERITVLGLLIQRLQLSLFADEVIIATTIYNNKEIVDVTNEFHVGIFAGDEDNVLKRYYDTAKSYGLDIIIRITSDCPFSDPKYIDGLIYAFLNDKCDYLRNFENPIHAEGFDVEIMTFDTLQRVYYNVKDKINKEHVTRYIYTNPKSFKISSYPIKILEKYGNKLRLTIDEKPDLEICREVYKRIINYEKDPIKFTIQDIVEIIDNEPELMNINRHVNQKII